MTRIIDQHLGAGIGAHETGELAVGPSDRAEQPLEVGLLGVPEVDDVVLVDVPQEEVVAEPGFHLVPFQLAGAVGIPA